MFFGARRAETAFPPEAARNLLHVPIRLVSERTGTVLVTDLTIAASARARTKGLLGRDSMGHGEGLLLKPCKQIHTFGMGFAIDVIFLDEHLRAVSVVHSMSPMRVTMPRLRARSAVELPAGAAKDVMTGDRLILEQH